MSQEIYIHGDTLVKVTALTNAETAALVNTATITMGLFKATALHPEPSELAFTSGGVAEPAVGDVIEGATGGATAVITAIVLSSGTWAGGDAVGFIEIARQFGTFEAENIDQVDGQGNIATIPAGDSSGSESADAGASTKIHIRNHDLIVGDELYIQGTLNYDGRCDVNAVEEDYVTVDAAWVAEAKFTGDEDIFVGIENSMDISLTHGGGDADGYYDGVLPDTMIGLVVDDYYWRFVWISNGGVVACVRQRCRAVYYLDVD